MITNLRYFGWGEPYVSDRSQTLWAPLPFPYGSNNPMTGLLQGSTGYAAAQCCSRRRREAVNNSRSVPGGISVTGLFSNHDLFLRGVFRKYCLRVAFGHWHPSRGSLCDKRSSVASDPGENSTSYYFTQRMEPINLREGWFSPTSHHSPEGSTPLLSWPLTPKNLIKSLN